MASSAAKTGKCVIRPCLVHGNAILPVTKNMVQNKSYIEYEEIDGLITNVPGIILTSTHGDCIPVYAYDPVKQVIGLAHAGWKGTSLGIAGKLIESMKKNYDCNSADIYAYIGPGIDKCHFEFGIKEAEEFFYSKNPWTKNYAYPHKDLSKLYLDLKGINRQFMLLEGVKNIEISSECTYCNADKFYSYRRSKDTDRMLAYIEIN